MSHTELGIDTTSLAGVTQDSRKVQQDFLFAALDGETVDGRNYIRDAIENGASVILSDNTVPKEEGAEFILVENPRKAFSHVVADFYSDQPDSIIAVTGTNGKSSVVHFINQLWQKSDKKSAFIGTLCGNMTTPDPETLHEKLAQMYKDDITHVAIEASSHGLEQYRMDGVDISVAAFTSFSQDHLDYHKDMDAYLNAKMRLFSEILKPDGVAVLNTDIFEYQMLEDICKKRGIRTISYGRKSKDITLLSADCQGVLQDVKIEVFDKTYRFTFPLVGEFQVMNILCALGCVLAQSKRDTDFWLSVLGEIECAPGRLQHVAEGDFHAYVDYAHTPDALKTVLNSLRPHTAGRLICVFGCGGDRDTDKRSKMGEVASQLADIAIVTDDNPRSEDPAKIRKDVLSGMTKEAIEIEGRREAIERATEMMESNDILLVAGKGHEQGQIFNDRTDPFDDVGEVQKALRNRVKSKRKAI